VLDGYGSGLSPLDARMLGRLVRLGDLIPEILANEARLMIAFGALRQVQVAFDNAENRDTERQPQSSVALQAVYRLLGLTWPAQS
jgi:predicted SpoU family rRNA methylase